MKHSKEIAVITLLVIGLAGAGELYAATHQTQAPGETEISETVSGGPGVDQQAALSEHGRAALDDIRLARAAVNDGYVDNAKDLLNDAHALLGRVKSEDQPITVKTNIEVDGKQVKHETQSVKADMIPIMSEMQIVESYGIKGDKSPETSSAAKAQDGSQKTANAQNKPSKQRTEAIAKANEHLSKGDRSAAAEELQLVDLTLVDQTLSMPLESTTQSVNHALKLIDQNKLHEANLQLKKVSDDLVLTTHVVAAPEAGTATSSGQSQHTGQS